MRFQFGKSACLLYLFCLLGFGLSAQVTFVDSYYLQNKRLVHVQQPLDFATYAYTRPVLFLTDFKARNAATDWLPDSMAIVPPHGVVQTGAAWAVSVIQAADQSEQIPVLLWIAAYDSLVSPVYTDRNLNGDFNDDGPPLLLVPGRIPEPIDLLSKSGITFRIHLQPIAAVAPTPRLDSIPAQRIRKDHRWEIGISGHFGVSTVNMDYQFFEDGRLKAVQYDGPNNLKGLAVSGAYTHGPWSLGLHAGFDHLFYWASARETSFSEYTCPTGEPCAWRTYRVTVRAKDQLPDMRFTIGPQLSWLPHLGKGIHLGPILTPTLLLYHDAYYQPEVRDAKTYPLGSLWAWEGGLQLQFDTEGSALFLRASAYQSQFQPEGYFEAIGAQDLAVRHVGLRFSIGVNVGR